MVQLGRRLASQPPSLPVPAGRWSRVVGLPPRGQPVSSGGLVRLTDSQPDCGIGGGGGGSGGNGHGHGHGHGHGRRCDAIDVSGEARRAQALDCFLTRDYAAAAAPVAGQAPRTYAGRPAVAGERGRQQALANTTEPTYISDACMYSTPYSTVEVARGTMGMCYRMHEAADRSSSRNEMVDGWRRTSWWWWEWWRLVLPLLGVVDTSGR